MTIVKYFFDEFWKAHNCVLQARQAGCEASWKEDEHGWYEVTICRER